MKKLLAPLVLSTLEWSDGELTFAKGKPNLDGELLVGIVR